MHSVGRSSKWHSGWRAGDEISRGQTAEGLRFLHRSEAWADEYGRTPVGKSLEEMSREARELPRTAAQVQALRPGRWG